MAASVRTVLVVLAGAAVAAGLDAYLWQADFLLGAFLVALTGAWLLAGPLGVALALSPIGRRTPATRGLFMAGFVCGLTPWLLDFLPGMVAVAVCLLLAVGLATGLGHAPLNAAGPGTRSACTLAAMAVLLSGAAIWSGGLGGDRERSFAFAEREDESGAGPDVILISIDTLRADTVIEGRPADYELPAMDRLRAEGVWADWAVASSNQTLPSHVTMLSGLDPMDHGVRDNLSPVPQDLHWVAQDFYHAGWRTAAVISNPLLSGDLGFGAGFEVYDDSGVPNRNQPRAFGLALRDHALLLEFLDLRQFLKLYDRALFRAHRQDRQQGSGKPAGRAAHTNEQTLGHLDKLMADERPYFFFLHYMDPHDPYGTVAPFAGTRTDAYTDLPERYVPTPGAGYGHAVCDLIFADSQSADAAVAAEGMRGMELLRDAYREDIGFTDAMVGAILDRVAESGRPTVVLLTADHGEHFGEHDWMRHGEELYAENIHVPFMVWGVGVDSGVHLQHAPDLTDVAPTMLAYAGIEVPARYSGMVVNRANDKPRISLSADDDFFAIYDGTRKWIGAWNEKSLGPPTTVGYFLLDSDPAEQNNRAEEVPEDHLVLVRQANDRDRHARVGEAAVVDEHQLRMNQELGYVD